MKIYCLERDRKGINACILEKLNLLRFVCSKKDWCGFGYLKRDSGLYGHEDGRQGNEDRLHEKKQCTSRQEGLFLRRKAWI